MADDDRKFDVMIDPRESQGFGIATRPTPGARSQMDPAGDRMMIRADVMPDMGNSGFKNLAGSYNRAPLPVGSKNASAAMNNAMMRRPDSTPMVAGASQQALANRARPSGNPYTAPGNSQDKLSKMASSRASERSRQMSQRAREATRSHRSPFAGRKTR